MIKERSSDNDRKYGSLSSTSSYFTSTDQIYSFRRTHSTLVSNRHLTAALSALARLQILVSLNDHTGMNRLKIHEKFRLNLRRALTGGLVVVYSFLCFCSIAY